MQILIVNCKDCIRKFATLQGKNLKEHYKKQCENCRAIDLERCQRCVQLKNYELGFNDVEDKRKG